MVLSNPAGSNLLKVAALSLMASIRSSSQRNCLAVLQIRYANMQYSEYVMLLIKLQRLPVCVGASCCIQNFGSCSYFSEREDNV